LEWRQMYDFLSLATMDIPVGFQAKHLNFFV